MAGVVSGTAPGVIAGIIGYDVLARTVVEIPSHAAHKAAVSSELFQAGGRRRSAVNKVAAEQGGKASRQRRRSAPKYVPAAEGEGRVRLLPPYRRLPDMPPWMQALNWQPLRVVHSPPLCRLAFIHVRFSARLADGPCGRSIL